MRKFLNWLVSLLPEPRNFTPPQPDTSPAPVANYSTTLTTAQEGAKTRKELCPEVANILDNFEKEKRIDNDGLNKVASFYFNTPNIPPTFFVLRREMSDGACMNINSVVKVEDASGELTDLKVMLTDAVYGSDLTLTISVKLFHEFFQSFEPNFNITKDSQS